ncbi:MAG: site-specific integrase [Verrucomicrobiota bacterium]
MRIKTWQATSVQGIYRHRNRRLYFRTFAKGREQWTALKTTVMEVAKARAREKYKEMALKAETQAAADQGRMTMSDCMRLLEDRVKEGWSFRGRGTRMRKKVAPNTIRYRLQTLRSIQKSWPQLGGMDVRRPTEEDCEQWASRFAKRAAPSRFNSTLDTLRYLFEEAIRVKARIDNPALKVGRCALTSKNLSLPSPEQFQAFVVAIRTGRGWCSKDCADLVSFLAFTGARINEAAHVEWSDIDFVRGTVRLRITKNGKIRWVPMIAEAREQLERMRAQRTAEGPDVRVLRVREAQKAMNRAAQKVGMVRITHHDLRHLFATVCIESGVDIPTVSRWLGHLDGGVLAMKTYGHLRDEHSRQSALKVSFQVAPQIESGKVIAFPRPAVA